ncbi:MAG: hypothetical protein COT59_00235 [Candidatus Nealsonbacteria bacterium CG09_land_8_20_14_0_10_42_14]|uniref:EamA domain-containing protein n=1 Tax=Candidatus Nealsonbacteria bacterium CG09_land_8_20_14_0_10_42_14 TaxID=1974707 RepID=A0A2H0WXW9_9BACT|nr:MAG: hypothetical protein COT59_00235 [Candidatus Nealsonbacteria bacterium CG09_land_8_20_14_0_10_42_14]
MSWLVVTISAYFLLAIVSLFDRYFLVGSIPHPKVYTFYVSMLWCLAGLLLIPFVAIPAELNLVIFLGLAAGFIRTFAILFLCKSIMESEVSRTIPTIGGFLPIFSFLFFFLITPNQEILDPIRLAAFICLVLGSVLISLKKFSIIIFSFKDLKNPIITAFLFAATYFLIKLVFLDTAFLNGVFLLLIGGGLGAVSFLFFSETRKLIFSQRPTQKISKLFILGQIFGGLGIGSLYYAVFLAEPSQVPLVNALEGIRYVFLLFFVFVLAKKLPHLLKEEMSGSILAQKIIAILLIGGGLAILALR